MHCSWVQDRLVAFSDGELSPGEATFVAEHLDGCDDCEQLELRLAAVTPQNALEIPPEVMARMAQAVDDAVFEALEQPLVAPPPTVRTRWTRWLRRDRDLSNGAAIGYGLLLAACVGWGLSNWIAYQELQQEMMLATPVAVSAPTSPATIDSNDYEEASYRVDEPEENWR